MTEQELRDFIAQGETFEVEFKSDTPDKANGLSDDDLQEAVVCLANAEGGKLLLGVEDDGTITGLHAKHRGRPATGLSGYLKNVLQGNAKPDIQAEVVDTSQGQVAVIHVRKAVSLVSTSQGRILQRQHDAWGAPQCRTVYPQEIPSLLSVRGQYDHTEQLVTELRFRHLSRAELDRIRTFVERQLQADKALLALNDEELAKALTLVKSSEDGELIPTVAGVLLAGTKQMLDTYVRGHEVAFQELKRGGDVGANNFSREPLLRVWELYENFFTARNPEREVRFEDTSQRVAIPRYPDRAVREAFANALVHRDYSLLNAVYFQFQDDDRLLIASPGGFVNGISVQNLLTSEPKPRNPLLADIFKRLGLVERTGRGVPRIFDDVLSLGRPAPSYAGTVSSVRVTIPGGEADANFAELVLRTRRANRDLNWAHLLVMHHLSKAKELTPQETANLISHDGQRARVVLEELVDWGLVEPRGRTHRTYHLSRQVYGQLDQMRDYENRKQAGASADDDEERVLEYLRARGRITRAEVGELNRLDPRRAEYLLGRMRDAGLVKLVGRGRGAHYIPGSLPIGNSEKNSE